MGEFQEQNQQIHERLIEVLEEDGYNVTSAESDTITEFIRNPQLENHEEFKALVERSKTQINRMRSKGESEGFSCGNCGNEITFETNAGTGYCVDCENDRD